jgi:hypothetical protein
VEAERLRREQQADRLNRMGESTFGRQGVGEQEGSEGVTPGTGTNQGTTTGTPGATNYGDGSGLGDGPAMVWAAERLLEHSQHQKFKIAVLLAGLLLLLKSRLTDRASVVTASIGKSTFSDPCINNAVLDCSQGYKIYS